MPEPVQKFANLSTARFRLTARAFGLGLVGVLALSGLVSYSDLGVSIGWMGGSHLPAAAVGLFLILILLNAVVRRFAFGWRLRPAELMFIYAMMLVGAILPSFGLSAQLIPCLIGLNYFTTPENRWGPLFYPYLKPWLVPFDPQVREPQPVAKDFYEGLHYGEPLPWGAWLAPLGAWTAFAFLLFGLLLCLGVILRRQWIDHEKLSFPLVHLPLELVGEDRPRGATSPFWKSRVMWLGFVLPALVHSLNGFHVYFPAVPSIPVNISLNQYLVTRPWADLGYTPLFLSFSVVGFSYLIPLDIAFSFWFFFLFSRIQAIIASSFGFTLERMPLFPAHLFIGYQAAGGSIIFALYMLWTARPHLRQVFRAAWGQSAIGNRQSAIGNLTPDEPLSPRFALFGLAATTLLLAAWLQAAGMNFGVALAVIVLLVLFLVLVLTRCVSAAGLLMIQGLFRPTDLFAMFTSRASLGPHNLTVLAFIDPIFIRDLRGSLLPTFLDSFKIGEQVQMKGRHLVFALVAATVVATAASYYAALTLIYRHGGVTMSGWFLMANPQIAFQDTAALLQHPPDPTLTGLTWCVIGALFTLFLLFMRTRFLSWPFHPLGYIMGASWSLILFWFPFFIGWLAKTLILRYGGAKFFLAARPFFLGLILGEFSMAVVWGLVSAGTGVKGPLIPVS